ncbi:MAG: hypothetical protein KBD07_04385 [Candidatus Omnitrophica bacterium]|nr:hypothetical protein [Candidatus Omnitrophota bacterium]
MGVVLVAGMLVGVDAAAESSLRKEVIEKEFYPDQTLKAELRYVGGLMNGESRFYAADGTLAQTCEYKDGKPAGALRTFRSDGSMIGESYVLGGMHHGPRKSFYPNGTLKDEAGFFEDALSGEARQYYENGKVKLIETFENDRITGTKTAYFENGELMSEACCYEAGLLTGESNLYGENGRLEWKVPFLKGEMHGLAAGYYDDGAVKARVNYQHGLWDGPSAEFYRSGAKLSEALFTEGSGVEKRFYESGELKSEIPYKANLEEGLARLYRKDGTLEFEDRYQAGELRSRKMFDPAGRVLFRQSYRDWKLAMLFGLDQKYGWGKPDTSSQTYPGGWIQSLQKHKYGIPHGIWEEYYDGVFEGIRYRDTYWEGRRISRREYDREGRQIASATEENIYRLILKALFSRPSSDSAPER